MKTSPLAPVPPEKTLVRRSAPRFLEREFVDDVVLFSVALSGHAELLVQGFDADVAVRAHKDVCQWRRVAAGERHAALAQRFGPGPRSALRLQRVVEVASPELKRAIALHVPPFLRHVLEGADRGSSPGSSVPDLLSTLAARLVREANQAGPSRAPVGASPIPDGGRNPVK